MHIVFTRTKEDALAIARKKKNSTTKMYQRKIFVCIIIGFALLFYSGVSIGDGIDLTSFSGYSLIGALFLGGAVMLYLDKFYPKLSFSPVEVIENYNKNERNEFNLKIELTDDFIRYDVAGISVKVDWACFKGFYTYKDNIFLLKNKTDKDPWFIIKRKELTDKQYGEFCDFLHQKPLNNPAGSIS
jgi:hypothetical protein